MADVQQDRFSLPNQIARAEERVARQRQIVDDLRKFRSEGPAARLLAIMENTLAQLHEREQELAAPQPPQPETRPTA